MAPSNVRVHRAASNTATVAPQADLAAPDLFLGIQVPSSGRMAVVLIADSPAVAENLKQLTSQVAAKIHELGTVEVVPDANLEQSFSKVIDRCLNSEPQARFVCVSRSSAIARFTHLVIIQAQEVESVFKFTVSFVDISQSTAERSMSFEIKSRNMPEIATKIVSDLFDLQLALASKSPAATGAAEDSPSAFGMVPAPSPLPPPPPVNNGTARLLASAPPPIAVSRPAVAASPPVDELALADVNAKPPSNFQPSKPSARASVAQEPVDLALTKEDFKALPGSAAEPPTVAPSAFVAVPVPPKPKEPFIRPWMPKVVGGVAVVSMVGGIICGAAATYVEADSHVERNPGISMEKYHSASNFALCSNVFWVTSGALGLGVGGLTYFGWDNFGKASGSTGKQ